MSIEYIPIAGRVVMDLLSSIYANKELMCMTRLHFIRFRGCKNVLGTTINIII